MATARRYSITLLAPAQRTQTHHSVPFRLEEAEQAWDRGRRRGARVELGRALHGQQILLRQRLIRDRAGAVLRGRKRTHLRKGCQCRGSRAGGERGGRPRERLGTSMRPLTSARCFSITLRSKRCPDLVDTTGSWGTCPVTAAEEREGRPLNPAGPTDARTTFDEAKNPRQPQT